MNAQVCVLIIIQFPPNIMILGHNICNEKCVSTTMWEKVYTESSGYSKLFTAVTPDLKEWLEGREVYFIHEGETKGGTVSGIRGDRREKITFLSYLNGVYSQKLQLQFAWENIRLCGKDKDICVCGCRASQIGSNEFTSKLDWWLFHSHITASAWERAGSTMLRLSGFLKRLG